MTSNLSMAFAPAPSPSGNKTSPIGGVMILDIDLLLPPKASNKPFMVVLDEFGYYAAPGLASLFSQARSVGSAPMMGAEHSSDVL